jgi:hypothetical protein
MWILNTIMFFWFVAGSPQYQQALNDPSWSAWNCRDCTQEQINAGPPVIRGYEGYGH